MANPNAGKQTGQPCAKCNTPLSAGRDGKPPYCKPCYNNWKNTQKPKGGSSAPKYNGGKSKADQKSIILAYAKDLVVALINKDVISNEAVAIVSTKSIADSLIKWYKESDGKQEAPQNQEFNKIPDEPENA